MTPFLEKPLTRRFAFLSMGLILISHWALWLWLAAKHQIEFIEILDNWDAGWYLEIARNGYQQEQAHAFYPGWPLVIRAITALIFDRPTIGQSAGVGSLLATFLLCGFTFLVTHRKSRHQPKGTDDQPAWWQPHNRLGWLFFILFPTSYVFQTVHTESLFIFVTALTLYFHSNQRFAWAAVFCGLATLVRNEGVLLAIGLGLSGFSVDKKVSNAAAGTPASWWKPLAIYGVIAGFIWSLYPGWLWFNKGEPLLFMKAQSYWTKEVSWATWLKTFWFGNPWQNTNLGSLIRHGIFLTMLVGVVAFWRARIAHFFAIYLVLFYAIRPLQGELVSTLRFQSTLFPLMFFLGSRLISPQLKKKSKFHAPLLWAIVVILLVLNSQLTRAYGLLRWAY